MTRWRVKLLGVDMEAVRSAVWFLRVFKTKGGARGAGEGGRGEFNEMSAITTRGRLRLSYYPVG